MVPIPMRQRVLRIHAERVATTEPTPFAVEFTGDGEAYLGCEGDALQTLDDTRHAPPGELAHLLVGTHAGLYTAGRARPAGRRSE